MGCGNEYFFGSVSGSTFAFYLFLGISAVVAVGTYTLLSSPKLRAMWPLERTPATRIAMLAIASLFGLLIFLGVYFSSLEGFYVLESRDDEIRLQYILPRRVISLPVNQVSEARREPSFKGRWRLTLYTPGGRQFVSANASYASVKQAWDCLEVRLPARKGQ